MRVIARAYRDRPLDRAVVSESKNLAYIADLSAQDANGHAEATGVGFPKDCVFEFDEPLFESLSAAWKAADRNLLEGLWSHARPVVWQRDVHGR